jgi:hypothetical protein
MANMNKMIIKVDKPYGNRPCYNNYDMFLGFIRVFYNFYLNKRRRNRLSRFLLEVGYTFASIRSNANTASFVMCSGTTIWLEISSISSPSKAQRR